MGLKNIQRKTILKQSRMFYGKSVGGGDALYSRQKSGCEGGYKVNDDKSGLVEERWVGEAVIAGYTSLVTF